MLEVNKTLKNSKMNYFAEMFLIVVFPHSLLDVTKMKDIWSASSFILQTAE